MSDHNYSTALSHAILAGTSIYCLTNHLGDIGTICFGLITTNSLLGLWRWGNPESGSTSKKIYETTAITQEMLALGAIAADMWSSSNILPTLWSAQILIPIVPLSFFFLDKDYGSLEQSAIIFNSLSIIYVSILIGNWWGLAAVASYLWGYLYVKNEGTVRDIPAIDLINYELCFFSYFALKALGH